MVPSHHDLSQGLLQPSLPQAQAATALPQHVGPRKRGAGARSDAALAQAAAALRSSRILLDSICIGNSDFSVLKAMSLSTGGYCFKPRRLRDALKLNEVGQTERSRRAPPVL